MYKKGTKTKCLMWRENHARRKKSRGWGRLQRGNSSEKSCRHRAEYIGKTRETGTRKNLKEGPKGRIENKELIVNGKVVLTNCKMW